MKALVFNLEKKWFDLIAQGIKTIEFRKITPHWKSRMFHKNKISQIIGQDFQFAGPALRRFDEVHFSNGYKPKAICPFMRVEWIGVCLSKEPQNDEPLNDELHYAIHLGKVLEVRNWKKG